MAVLGVLVAMEANRLFDNNRRLFTPIGDIPPAEYEAMYYRGKQGHA